MTGNDLTFKDVRDGLPNDEEQVVFLYLEEGSFAISSGTFNNNPTMEFWAFTDHNGASYTKGSVFKWAPIPTVNIDMNDYPEGKKIPAKYCRFSASGFHDLFFGRGDIKTTKGSDFADCVTLPEDYAEAKNRMINIVPDCKCGAIGKNRAVAVKTVMVPMGTTTYEPKCDECMKSHKVWQGHHS